VTLLSPLGPVVPEKSTVPPLLLMMVALPAVALFSKNVAKPLLFMMVALPAVLES
jgi:hypothetical protein